MPSEWTGEEAILRCFYIHTIIVPSMAILRRRETENSPVGSADGNSTSTSGTAVGWLEAFPSRQILPPPPSFTLT